MKKSILLLGLALSSSILVAEDVNLDKVTVESSTITDNTIDGKTEASTVNVVSEKTITQIDPKNINELLQTIPGITADVRSGDTVEIHMRGVGQQEFMWEDTGVAIVIDGVPVLQNGGKVKFNLDEIESIKVIKGGASYLYGNTALSGAVIITTKKPRNKNGYSISAEYGSENYKNLVASLYKGTDKYSLNINANYRYTDGYWDMSESNLKSANGTFQYYIDDMSDITFGADITRKYDQSSRGSVTGVTEASENPTGANDGDLPWNSDYYSDIDKYFLTYNRDFDNGGNLKVNSYYYEDLYNFLSSPQDLTGDGDDDAYTSDNDENIKQYGVKTEYKGSTQKMAYMLGLDLGKRELDDSWIKTETYTSRGRWYYAGESSDSTSKEDKYAVYGEIKYKINTKLTAIFNTRVDYDKYDYSVFSKDYNGTDWSNLNTDDSDNFTNVSYRVGTTYDLDEKKTLFANISTGFRNPTVKQTYAGNFYPDDYVNNPNLDVETTVNYEVGIRGKQSVGNNILSYEASVYQLDTKDIIGKNGGTYYSNNNNIMYDNVGDARSRGIELSLKSDRSKKVSFSLAYTYLDAYYTSHKPFTVDLAPLYRATGDETYDINGNQLPRTPHHKIDLIVNYKPTSKVDVMTELYAQSHYYADETNFVTMPGYAKVNLKVAYRHNKNLEFFAKIDNVLDKQYYRTVYLFSDKNYDGKLDAEDASITVDPGRVFYAGFKYKF